MAKKVIIEKGKKKSYAVIYGEGVDHQTGMHSLKQKGFRTSEEADKFLKQLGSIKEGVHVEMKVDQKDDGSIKVSFSQYAKEWFYREHAQEISVRTFKLRKNQLEKHIVPYFGDMNLQEITEKDMEGLYAEKRREGYTDRFILGIHAFLNSIYQSAIQKGLLKMNPTKALKNMFKDVDRTLVPWSNEEVTQFLNVADAEGEGLIYEFAIGTGVRLVELLAISWSDVDLDEAKVTVSRNVSVGGKCPVEIRSGARTIELPAYFIPKLKKHKEDQQLLKKLFGDQSQGQLNLVFPKKDGGVQNPSIVQIKFARLVEKSGVRKIPFHGLRTTYTSLLHDAGVSLDYIKNQLGHERIETTLNQLYKKN